MPPGQAGGSSTARASSRLSGFAAGHLSHALAGETATSSRRHPQFPIQATSLSRAHPAGGSRRSPPIPANPRNAEVGKPCSRQESPPIHAQAGSAMTGLSRRRSRVRVPSLPLKSLQISIERCQSRRSSGADYTDFFAARPQTVKNGRLNAVVVAISSRFRPGSVRLRRRRATTQRTGGQSPPGRRIE